MNCKIGLLALVALQAYSTSALRPCVCARNFDPVCGSDGVTYSNDCKLECEKYNVQSDLTKVRDGPCEGDALPLCICTMEYRPVCGNDGVTYPNRCALRCKLPTDPKIETAHEGACEVPPPCTCTDDLNEVCGSDDKTYPNPCMLNCATANDSTLGIAHSGKCESVKVVDLAIQNPLCKCARNVKPVCGSDGKTYSNDCLLNCATANDNTLSISHSGPCGHVNVVDHASPSGCTCARNLRPVCGSDGTTYGNDCLLNCATAKDNTLSILHQGECGDVSKPPSAAPGSDCSCTRNLEPVCGSDGVSYNNICLLQCAGQSLASHGRC